MEMSADCGHNKSNNYLEPHPCDGKRLEVKSRNRWIQYVNEDVGQ